MHWSLLTSLLSLGLTAAQQVGHEQNETHPRLQWSSCAADGGCEKVDGEVTIDADFRWLHKVDTYTNCYDGNMWNHRVCDSVENCTTTCALEGADYSRVYGVKTANNTLSQRLRTNFDFAYNVGSRLYLMESQHRYQTFTLRDNELAFDVDLSTVECGINSALYFVPMDPDGGMARYATNAAGAEYGTGYCDASCPRSLRFVGGKANTEGWIPSETDPFAGAGTLGSCCPQFSVWNSNAHSFAMSSHVCYEDGPHVCQQGNCRYDEPYPERGPGRCAVAGCSYNPYRMGNQDFYGKGKTVDTARKFTVVTQWTEDKVTQFLIQDNQKFDIPAPTWEGLPQEAGLSRDMCARQFSVFGERDIMSELGGWEHHSRQLLDQPLVMVMSIGTDHYAWNLWLDSRYPPYDSTGFPGEERGDCFPIEDSEPWVVENMWPSATVNWSNIRFGPIGSTVQV
ncbi:glycoside hydrolase [Chaetomium sp. MPI-CAGE-AT-0009]|nr:glycoside hydrolase [Chaetomium sp. MPI-CAGE-AT-0009]